MDTTSPSDLTYAEWECLQPCLLASRSSCRTRRHSLRSSLNAIYYALLRTGCPWRSLPSSFPPWQTVLYHFRRLRLRGRWHVLFTALRYAERERLGRDPHPSAASMDAQSVKTVEESAHISGCDAHKRVKGRKRHLLVDTLGIPLSCYVTPADMQETQGPVDSWRGSNTLCRGSRLSGLTVRIEGKRWRIGAKWWATGISKSWSVHPARMASLFDRKDGASNEPSAGSRATGYRRMSKDDARKVQTSETLIERAMIRLLVARRRWRTS
jgi:putative transposase